MPLPISSQIFWVHLNHQIMKAILFLIFKAIQTGSVYNQHNNANEA